MTIRKIVGSKFYDIILLDTGELYYGEVRSKDIHRLKIGYNDSANIRDIAISLPAPSRYKLKHTKNQREENSGETLLYYLTKETNTIELIYLYPPSPTRNLRALSSRSYKLSFSNSQYSNICIMQVFHSPVPTHILLLDSKGDLYAVITEKGLVIKAVKIASGVEEIYSVIGNIIYTKKNKQTIQFRTEWSEEKYTYNERVRTSPSKNKPWPVTRGYSLEYLVSENMFKVHKLNLNRFAKFTLCARPHNVFATRSNFFIEMQSGKVVKLRLSGGLKSENSYFTTLSNVEFYRKNTSLSNIQSHLIFPRESFLYLLGSESLKPEDDYMLFIDFDRYILDNNGTGCLKEPVSFLKNKDNKTKIMCYDPSLIFDIKEPGYYRAMYDAFALVRRGLGRITAQKYCILHDIAASHFSGSAKRGYEWGNDSFYKLVITRITKKSVTELVRDGIIIDKDNCFPKSTEMKDQLVAKIVKHPAAIVSKLEKSIFESNTENFLAVGSAIIDANAKAKEVDNLFNNYYEQRSKYRDSEKRLELIAICADR